MLEIASLNSHIESANCRAERGFESGIYSRDVRMYVCAYVSVMLRNVVVTSHRNVVVTSRRNVVVMSHRNVT